MTSYAALTAELGQHRLSVMGGFAAQDDTDLPQGTKTLLLIGPAEPGFWAHMTAQAEWLDGKANPIDRWSQRVIGSLAVAWNATAIFPFGGPPWHPFHRWALASGRAWNSPVHLLVHDEMGLFASYRGALALPQPLTLPAAPSNPCDSCAAKPCLSACPPKALTAKEYDVPSCRSFLEGPSGMDCMKSSCRVRRACPQSQAYARLPEQSAYHMGQFQK